LVKFVPQACKGCVPDRRFARLGPSRAPIFLRLSTSTASLHVAPTADPRRSLILGKSWRWRHWQHVRFGHKRKYAVQNGMSALPPIATAKADMRPPQNGDVRFTPQSGHVRGNE
jgi:hypothetical protein